MCQFFCNQQNRQYIVKLRQ